MARYTKQNVNSVPSINAELTKIQTAINDTLSRKGDVPNQMEAVLDMNSNRIINIPEPNSDHEPVRLIDLKNAVFGGASGQNLGTGIPIYKETEEGILKFRTIKGVGGTTVSQVGDEVVIASTGGGGTGEVLGITLEEFDPDAGTGGDDTAAFESACAVSLVRKLPVQLLAKTYRIGASVSGGVVYSRNLYALQGVGSGSVLEFINDGVTKASDNFFDFTLESGGWFKDFHYDGNISADPEVWNNSTVDSWTGGRGYRIIGSTDFIVENVHVRNVYNPGHGLYNCSRYSVRNSTTIRARGPFGDGFISAEGEQAHYENCYAYDFTRIGFVTDKTTGSSTNNVAYTNCVAVYAHDASRLYGGIEFNTGFWTEFGVNVTYIRCFSYDTPDSGFRAPIISSPRFDAVLYAQDAWTVSYYDCVAGKTGEAFVAGVLGNNDGSFVYENCIGYDCNIGLYMGDDTFDTNPSKLTKFIARDCKFFLKTGKRALLPLGGDVTLENIEVYYPSDKDWLTISSDPDDGDATVSWFGPTNERPRRLYIKNLRAYRGDTKQVIPARIYIGANLRAGSELIVEDCENLFVDSVSFDNMSFVRCRFHTLGTLGANKRLLMSNCEVDRVLNFDITQQVPNFAVYSTTEYIRIKDTRFNLPANSQSRVYVANITNNQAVPKLSFMNCEFVKDYTTGAPILIGADNFTITTDDVHDYRFSDCVFINTGAATANPIIVSQVEAGVKIYGSGNYKSATITNDVGPNTTNPGAVNYIEGNF